MGALTIVEWARRTVPTLDVVSASVPEPVLQEHNLVAVCDDPDEARSILRTWERLEAADGAVGVVVMGAAPDDPSELRRDTGADPEGVTGFAVSSALRGAVPGAVLFGLVVALIAGVIDGWSSALIGPFLGGAAFGAVAGAFAAFVGRVSWGEAYRHSFVDPGATSVVFASIHSDDRDRIVEAERTASGDGTERRLYLVHRDGRARRVRKR